MIRLLLFIWLLHANLSACATCAVMTPMTEVTITLQGKKESIHNIHYRWEFSEVYSTELRFQFDDNNNGKIDPDELKEMESIKIDYLKPRNMLSTITYRDIGSNKEHPLNSRFRNFHLEYKDRQFIFSYDGNTLYEPQPESILSFVFQDSEGFFDFRVIELKKENIDFELRENTYLFTAAVLFENPSALSETPTKPSEE
ncbi:MAG: DUF1007 family protein, partial [Campylobacterota bacterium]|nr:DUF1007 family protein [Campylobacterota bacterium]